MCLIWDLGFYPEVFRFLMGVAQITQVIVPTSWVDFMENPKMTWMEVPVLGNLQIYQTKESKMGRPVKIPCSSCFRIVVVYANNSYRHWKHSYKMIRDIREICLSFRTKHGTFGVVSCGLVWNTVRTKIPAGGSSCFPVSRHIHVGPGQSLENSTFPAVNVHVDVANSTWM